MRIGTLVVRAGLVLALLIPSLAQAQDPLSSRQRRNLGRAEANRLVEKDLLSVLEPIDGFQAGMRRRNGSQTLFTKAYGTEFEGLCRKDLVSLLYAPADGRERYEDSPVAPYGVEAEAWFRMDRLPGPARSGFQAERAPLTDDCDRPGANPYLGWFGARSTEDAVRGAYAMMAAVAAVKAGTLKALPCTNTFPDTVSCEAVIVEAAQLESLNSVGICDAPPGRVCYAIELGASTRLTIVVTPAPEGLAPLKVESIAVEQYLIVT